MRTALLLLISVMVATGCAGTSGGTQKAYKPEPTPKPTPVDDRTPYNTNSQAVVKLSKQQAWKKIGNPDQWPSWNKDIAEAASIGAELSAQSLVSWTFQDEKIESSVVSIEADRSLKIKGTAAGKEATLEFVLRPMGSSQTLVMVNSQMPPGWGKKNKLREAQMRQLQSFLKGLQGLK